MLEYFYDLVVGWLEAAWDIFCKLLPVLVIAGGILGYRYWHQGQKQEAKRVEAAQRAAQQAETQARHEARKEAKAPRLFAKVSTPSPSAPETFPAASQGVAAFGNYVSSSGVGKYCQTVSVQEGELRLVIDHHYSKPVSWSCLEHVEGRIPLGLIETRAPQIEDSRDDESFGKVPGWSLTFNLRKPQSLTMRRWRWDTFDLSDGRQEGARFRQTRPEEEHQPQNTLTLNFDRKAQADRFVAALKALQTP